MCFLDKKGRQCEIPLNWTDLAPEDALTTLSAGKGWFRAGDLLELARLVEGLNEKGFKTGDGLPLTSIAVGYVRKAYGLKSRFDRLRERGMLTISEMARACGVSINTIGHWRQKGLIRAHAINDRTQFLFEHPDQTHRRSTAEKS